MMRAFTKAEIEQARTAYELIRAAGYPSYQEVIHLVQDGNIMHLPSLTAEDVQRAQELFGYPPGYVHGKLTKKTTGRAIVDNDLIIDRKEQVLHTDVMHIDGHKVLITVCEPLCLNLQVYIERESQSMLGMALQGHLELLCSRGFVPTRV